MFTQTAIFQLCTTGFLAEISQYIKFGDLTTVEGETDMLVDSEQVPSSGDDMVLPSFTVDELDGDPSAEPRLSDEDEDALLKDTTASFADWVTSFIRQVIQLLENLPEEGANGSAGGATEGAIISFFFLFPFSDQVYIIVQVVDAVAGACSQICVHLSEPLYDLVLNMVYDYASTNVRSNAVRAVHQLVECIANADPVKTLAKFLPFCTRNIRIELENGASSLRTTSASSPLPSDATLHWSV